MDSLLQLSFGVFLPVQGFCILVFLHTLLAEGSEGMIFTTNSRFSMPELDFQGFLH